jgi:hypothetical protein
MSAQTYQRSGRQDLVWGCSEPDFVPTASSKSRLKNVLCGKIFAREETPI